MTKKIKQKSFRDPLGFVIETNGKIYRGINKQEENFYKNLFSAKWFSDLVNLNKIQASYSQNLNQLNDQYFWLNHSKFHFPLFPHEISSEQLFKSALLTLEIAKISLQNNFVLKDASAWNVVFDKGRPIFIDVTSFEAYSGQSLWLAYGQFCRHFIIPLLLYKYLKISPAKLFLSSRDGVDPTDAKLMLRWNSFTSLAAFETVFLPTLIKGPKKNGTQIKLNTANYEVNKKILASTFLRLESYIKNLQPSRFNRKSTWSEYESDRFHYSSDDLDAKYSFVSDSLKQTNGPVLDIGCNQGEYSLLAASFGLSVLATDFDEDSLNKLESKNNLSNLSISLLNICEPTPSIGWDNNEHISFLEKARGNFEMVLCLGLIHHMLVTERIPLNLIIEFLLKLSNKYLVLEWVDYDDQKFMEISSYQEKLYSFLNSTYFEKLINDKFKIIKKLKLQKAKRTLYLLEKLCK
jgi:2-polyprenyl-3-methyl-5-hydroxy-6-metoxy-1,4-benzoquinol methylase